MKGDVSVNKNTLTAAVTAIVAVLLSSGIRTGDSIDEQTEENRNSQAVVTLPAGGPITIF